MVRIVKQFLTKKKWVINIYIEDRKKVEKFSIPKKEPISQAQQEAKEVNGSLTIQLKRGEKRVSCKAINKKSK